MDQGGSNHDRRGVVPMGSPYSGGALATPIDFARGGEDYYPREGGFDFWKALKVLIHRKWLIIAVVVAGLAVAGVLTLRKAPLYRAEASLEIQKQETKIVESADMAPAVVADAEFMQTQYALLQSRSLAERVAESLDLPADKRYANQKATRDQRLSQAVERLQKNLKVAPVARSRVIDVQFTSAYPQESARVANAFAEGFIESNLERKYNATAYARNFLEDRLKTTKESLEASERKLVEYARTYNLIDLGSGKAAEVGESLDASSLIALNTAKTEAENARIAAEHKYIEARESPSALQTLSSETITELKSKRATLSADYQEKLSTFKPEFPEMLELKARIDGIDGEIAKERTNIVKALEADFKSAKAREESLKGRVTELSGSLQTERDTRIEYNIIHREVDTNRSQYEALLQRLKEVSISSGVGSSQVAIVDRAQTPKLPFSPNIPETLLRALILSLALGIALAFALEYIDDTIKSPEDVKTKLGLPCIGVVPKTEGDFNIVEEVRDRRSRVAEAFFSARTALQFSTSNGAPGCLLVTGTRPAEGKTSAAVGLALSFASTGKRVLIIDADLRKPSFASPTAHQSIGLSGLLVSDASLAPNVIPGEAPNLYLLPSGVVPPNPAELLASTRLGYILGEARNQFDLVIVDSCPVMNFADAVLLGAACDAALVIVQTGAVRRPAIQRTLDRLAESRTSVIGVLLSKFDAKRESYGYGYGDEYAKGYGSTAADSDSAPSGESESRRRISLFSKTEQDSADRWT